MDGWMAVVWKTNQQQNNYSYHYGSEKIFGALSSGGATRAALLQNITYMLYSYYGTYIYFQLASTTTTTTTTTNSSPQPL